MILRSNDYSASLFALYVFLCGHSISELWRNGVIMVSPVASARF
jgi:hypothetical protein